MIEVRRLMKHFGPVCAVNGATFCAQEGEVLGLLGPNGAGKTTTLRLVPTVLRPTVGTGRVDDLVHLLEMPDFSPLLPWFAVPIFGTLIVLRDLFLGRAAPMAFGLMVVSSLTYAALAVALAVWQFNRERVLFRT